MISSILLSVTLLNIFLGFFILLRNFSILANKLFSLMCFLAAIWSAFNYMTVISASVFWLQGTYSLGSLVLSIGLIWTIVLTEEHLHRVKLICILFFAFLFSVCSYIPGFIIRSSEQVYKGTIFSGDAGWGLVLYTVFYIFLTCLILFKLFISQKKCNDERKKYQLRYVLIGATITLIITAFSSFILPHFSIFLFGGIDNIGFLFFLIFVTYAITKHHLFSLKIIAVELIVFTLWIFLLMRTLLSKNFHDVVTEGSILFITFILGILLIKSVIQGIKQRKEIEELTTNLAAAYDHIKKA